MGQFIQGTTLKQCENITVDILKEKLNITELEAKNTLEFLETEDVVVKKYIFQCNKCGDINTFTEDMITGTDVCQICECEINVRAYVSGAEIRYILDRNNFMELLDEEGIVIPRKISNVQTKTKVVLFEEAKKTDGKERKQRSMDMEKEKKVELFISHATKDSKYIECFVNFLEELGFDDSNMFCSSVEGYGIPWGGNIYEYLEGKFTNKDNELMVLFMLSDNYYDSAACLNEMGAAWVLKKNYRSILLPGFEFKNIEGAVDPRKIAIKLDDEKLMTKLNDVKEQLTEIFDLKSISSTKWDKIRTDLIKKIKDIKEEKDVVASV